MENTTIEGCTFGDVLKAGNGVTTDQIAVKNSSNVNVLDTVSYSGSAAFKDMFYGCTKYLQDYTYITLDHYDDYAFAGMFAGCTSLTYFNGDFNIDNNRQFSRGACLWDVQI